MEMISSKYVSLEIFATYLCYTFSDSESQIMEPTFWKLFNCFPFNLVDRSTHVQDNSISENGFEKRRRKGEHY